MSHKDIKYDHLKQVVNDLGQVFSTKDVSEDARMKNAHPNLVKHSHYHAFVGRALSDHRAELDIKVIQKGTSRGSRWQKTSSFHNGSPKNTQTYDHSDKKTNEDKMDELVTLVCPTCGGKLQVSQDLDRFICAHCGNEHIIRHSGGTISIKPVVEQIEVMRNEVFSMKQSVSINNAELAVARITKEISALRNELRSLEKKSKSGNSAHGIIWVISLMMIFVGAIAIPVYLGVTIIAFIIGIPLFISSFVISFKIQNKIQHLKERIQLLEEKRKANLRIINRG